MSFGLSRRFLLKGGVALASVAVASRGWTQATRPTLPIPTLIDGMNGEPVDLELRHGEWSFRPGVRTATLGINQDYLGPTLRTRRNTELNLRYQNSLSEGASIHGHGLHVPGDVDGGPQLEIPPGASWNPTLRIVQPAATCWYHSHTHGKSGDQTYRGLAGMIIIDDEESEAIGLPNTYGVDDIPIIIQDRTFDQQGQFVYSLMDAGEDGWLGETVVINGAIDPVKTVPKGNVRLRILNGANARFYVVAFSDNRPFYKIACDGGLLSSPTPLTSMEMSPGERCEIIVDMSDGAAVELLTLFEDQFDEEGVAAGLLNFFTGPASPVINSSLRLEVDAQLTPNITPLPDRLAQITRPQESDIVRTRDFALTMEHSGDHGGHGQGHAAMDMMINGAAMDMSVINERVDRGVWERWRVRSDQGAHPFHVHGCSFLIERMEGAATPPDQQGWKDVVVLDDDD